MTAKVGKNSGITLYNFKRFQNSCYPVIIPKKDSSTPNFSNASRFRKSRLHTSSDHKKTGSRASSNEGANELFFFFLRMCCTFELKEVVCLRVSNE